MRNPYFSSYSRFAFSVWCVVCGVWCVVAEATTYKAESTAPALEEKAGGRYKFNGKSTAGSGCATIGAALRQTDTLYVPRERDA